MILAILINSLVARPPGDGAATFSPYGFALPNNKSRNRNHHLVQKTSINYIFKDCLLSDVINKIKPPS